MERGIALKRLSIVKIRLVVVFLFLLGITNNSSTPLANTYNVANSWDHKLDLILQNHPSLSGAIAGVSIRSATSGKIIYEHFGDYRLKPASNLKLLTAAAALSALGENYRFHTDLFVDGPIVGNMLFGNLIVKGKGDPTLLKSDFDEFADTLVQKGITVIQGNLIGDDSWYDDVRYSKDLPWSDEHTYYGAQLSALTASPDKDYDAGSVKIVFQPAKKAGEKANYSTLPNTDYLKVVNELETVEEDELKEINMIREHGTNTISIDGTIPLHSGKIVEWISVWNPTGYALDLFKQSLSEKGISLDGEVIEGITPKTATLLYSHQSMPLSDLLVPFMKLSNNVHGETLVKEMGKVKKGEGSWEKGLEVLEEELIHLGVNTKDLILRDGSGISHLNLVPANEISNLLYSVQKESWFPAFQLSLPINGEKNKMVGGTLRNRMMTPSIKRKVIAKTGTLTSVSSLSGYVKSRSGETIIFSVILNNLLDEEQAKEVEDQIATLLANQ
jgi:serine-type D-Ala-D-Ala carboxypeptidase/endopeptidase (penicillin-binding protein 4)